MKNITKSFQSFLIILSFSVISEAQVSLLDSLRNEYSIAAQNYNIELFNKIEYKINNIDLNLVNEPDKYLLLGLIYWRKQLISYCDNLSGDIIENGKKAIKELNKAENLGIDQYLTGSHKALAYLLMASTGLKNGFLYTQKVDVELKKIKKLRPEGYFTLLIEAIKLNMSPSIAGGNPDMAVTILEDMSLKFPDSLDIKIHLAEAYIKTNNTKKARILLENILELSPSNLLAKKVLKVLE